MQGAAEKFLRRRVCVPRARLPVARPAAGGQADALQHRRAILDELDIRVDSGRGTAVEIAPVQAADVRMRPREGWPERLHALLLLGREFPHHPGQAAALHADADDGHFGARPRALALQLGDVSPNGCALAITLARPRQDPEEDTEAAPQDDPRNNIYAAVPERDHPDVHLSVQEDREVQGGQHRRRVFGRLQLVFVRQHSA